ncbi:MAG: PorT family protein [Tannerellaceae bacterium]|jgi:hypothetical protein|nr:PorT family protein [Tannerellaceae bacterium]
MKHLTWFLFLSAINLLPLGAQSVLLTPRAGLNLSTITGAEATMKTGLNFGIGGEYLPSPNARLAFASGLFYSMQGCDLKESAVNPEHNYLSLPVLLKYYVQPGKEGNHQGLSLYGGPQFDLKAVGNKVSYATEYSGVLLSDDMSKTFGMSAVIGVEYLFEVGLVLAANVNIGLTNKAKDGFLNYGTLLTSQNTYKDLVIQLSFGYRFAIL